MKLKKVIHPEQSNPPALAKASILENRRWESRDLQEAHDLLPRQGLVVWRGKPWSKSGTHILGMLAFLIWWVSLLGPSTKGFSKFILGKIMGFRPTSPNLFSIHPFLIRLLASERLHISILYFPIHWFQQDHAIFQVHLHLRHTTSALRSEQCCSKTWAWLIQATPQAAQGGRHRAFAARRKEIHKTAGL